VRETELYAALESAIDELPPRDRLMIKLKFEDDLPMAELSRNLGYRNRFSAHRRLTEVLQALRRALERAGIRDAVP